MYQRTPMRSIPVSILRCARATLPAAAAASSTSWSRAIDGTVIGEVVVEEERDLARPGAAHHEDRLRDPEPAQRDALLDEGHGEGVRLRREAAGDGLEAVAVGVRLEDRHDLRAARRGRGSRRGSRAGASGSPSRRWGGAAPRAGRAARSRPWRRLAGTCGAGRGRPRSSGELRTALAGQRAGVAAALPGAVERVAVDLRLDVVDAALVLDLQLEDVALELLVGDRAARGRPARTRPSAAAVGDLDGEHEVISPFGVLATMSQVPTAFGASAASASGAAASEDGGESEEDGAGGETLHRFRAPLHEAAS